MILNDIQLCMQSVYEVETEHQISDFLTTNLHLQDLLSDKGYSQYETVFIREDDDYLDIAIYLHQSIVEELEATHTDNNIDNLCYALEGISHFLYLIHNASYDRSVTQLEMELQAEVDKFIYLNLLGVNLDEIKLHKIIFEEVNYRQSLDVNQRERYETANAYAEKYCFHLLKNYPISEDSFTLKQEICKFYRMSLQDKMYRINRLH